jgi:hypothetical protein
MLRKMTNLVVAGANFCSAVEAETISKNAVSPKNQKSRGNLEKINLI